GQCRTVGCCARAGRDGWLRREGHGTPAVCPIPLESRHGGALVISDGCTDLAGHGQAQCHILGREPVRAALFKEEAVSWTSAECVDFVAHAAFTHVTDATGSRGHCEGTDPAHRGSPPLPSSSPPYASACL